MLVMAINNQQPMILAVNWSTLRTNYPDLFTIGKQDNEHWHQIQAAQTEHAGNWEAAAFHLSWVAKLHPDDTNTAAHITRVTEHIRQASAK